MNAIEEQMAKYGATAVQAYLKTLATPEVLKIGFHGYFNGTPSPAPP